MNNLLKRFFSVFLMTVLTFSTIAVSIGNGGTSYASSSNSVSISRNEIVKNNVVYLNSTKNNNINASSTISYVDNNGEELKFSPVYNDDTETYYFEVLINKAGNWKVKEHNIEGITNIDELDITVHDTLNDMTGSSTGYVYTSAITGNSNISGENLEQILSQLIGLNRNGNYSEVKVTIGNGNSSGIFYIDFDGVSSSINIPSNIYLEAGNYTLTIEVDGYSTTENIVLTTDYTNVEDINYDESPQLRSLSSTSKLSSDFYVKRYSGNDRYATAVEISKSKFSTAENIILVNGDSVNEILSAASLAKQKNAPILLTKADTLNNYSEAEINRLKAKNIFIVGSEKEIGKGIETKLQNNGKVVTRLTGSNIYKTAISVAKQLSSFNTVIVSSSSSYSDSLSAAALSASKGYPILYVENSSIPNDTLNYIKSSNCSVILVGGPATISNSVQDKLKAESKSVTRVHGANRYGTSINLAKNYFSSTSIINLATGNTFADSLSGASVAGLNNSPVVLVEGNSVSADLKGYITSSKAKTINIYGGPASVSKEYENSVQKTLNEIYNSSSIQGSNTSVKILLDPGHGAGSSHNRGYVGPRWKNEGDGNYYFSLLLKKELEAYGIQVGTTRASIGKDPSLASRGQSAKGYDLFISLHTNALNGSAKGVEIYEDVNARATSLATNLTKTISSTLGTSNRGVKYRYYGANTSGVNPKSNYYGVLRNNAAPAGMLIEHCFHDNLADVTKYESKAETLAKNMASTIASYYGVK
ncbi:cell wall-binding repeat-containing protein [Miniphocaeibacter halophilus]|uniref:Cell wall-binding repeat-containing protein n=1 Tax=Miniphocaeibacter halophilus TaxID=2931922 RepID=A0AC61N398_9FIRM|nr:cell wall-binding repeat-containing protein [Miniphocaeibacter halophilus]QQK07838.1 cell wall-binding repeat-containing protein [Miniphocaeibacter halophilus]